MISSLRQHHFPTEQASVGRALLYSGYAMWMADLKHGEHVDEIPAYAPAFKEVYRFILEALEGNDSLRRGYREVSGRGNAGAATWHCALP